MLTAALSTKAKTRKQPKCLSTDEWIKRSGVYILLSIIKDEIMLLTATWMDLEIIFLSEVSQKDKDK